VVVAAGFAEDVDVEVAAWFGPFVVLFSEHGADEARLLRRHRAAERRGAYLFTVFHDDTCPALASRTRRRHA
jgi:hypothetical protein